MSQEHLEVELARLVIWVEAEFLGGGAVWIRLPAVGMGDEEGKGPLRATRESGEGDSGSGKRFTT